jgi:hypothetical protein
MNKLVLLQLFYWSLLPCLLIPAVYAAEDASKPVLRIGVVYHVGDTGNRILSGVNRAVKRYSNGNEKLKVEVVQYPYLDENSGIDSILSIFDDKSIHLVLGPSDSGVFVDLAKRAEYKEKALIPVVSPLVTAQDGNKEGDWRFRTNVDVEARARAASDFLSHASYRAVAVLYRNNEFGKRASEAFKNQLITPEQDYLALPYEGEVQLREQVRKMLEQRPGAVGVFGRRHDLKIVRREFEALNSGWFEYRPLLFSINDTRALKLPDTYFVSLVGPNKKSKEKETAEVWDEVRGLSYDTTLLVLSVAEQIRSNPGDKNWATSFRKRLFTRMLGPPQTDDMFRTGMEFSDGKNLAPPIVLRLTADAGEQIAVAGHTPEKLWKLGDWIEIRERRYGIAIWVNLVIVAGVALWLTMADIRRRQSIRSRGLYFCRPVIALIFFNVIGAVATLVIVAELGIIRWNNVLAALGVAVGHRAMLTTTIFETAQGRALGFGRLYERTLASINERIMMSLYEKQSAAINYVTYTNSLPNLRDLLINIYGFAHDGSESRVLIEALDADIARAKGALKKQEVCARRLLQTMSWKQLQANRVIPDYINQDELIDPNTILRDAVQYVLKGGRASKNKTIDLIEATLSELERDSVKSKERAEKELNEALDNAQTERGRLYYRLRWLFTQWGFSLRRINEEGLLDKDYTMSRGKRSPLLSVLSRGKKQMTSTEAAECSLIATHKETNEHRQEPRISIDCTARLEILDEDHKSICELDVSIVDVSAGGARILIEAGMLDGIPDELSFLHLHIPDGPLAGVSDEVQRVYQLASDSGIQMGIAWSASTAEVCERVRQLVV